MSGWRVAYGYVALVLAIFAAMFLVGFVPTL